VSTKERLQARADGRAATKPIPGPPVTRLKKDGKKPKNGRRKGAAYELKIAKKLADWCGEVLRRTPMSGGWSKDAAFGVGGDLVCDNPCFSYHVEMKKREGWRLEDLLTGANNTHSSSILEWWRQTLRESAHTGKIPLLIFSRNLLPDLVMLRYVSGAAQTLIDLPNTLTARLPGFEGADAEVVIATLNLFLSQVQPPPGTKGHKTWRKA
jgi:hypothetical protein